MYRYFAALMFLAAVFLIPSGALCEEPQVYFSRHFTLWYYTEHDFMKLESLFREGPMKEVSGYGPETEYLGVKLEELYSAALSRLGAGESGRRFLVVLLKRNAADRDLYNQRGLSVTEGAAHYDPSTKALFVYPGRAGLRELARELVNALMDAENLLPASAGARYLVSVPLADDICAEERSRRLIR